MAGATSSSPTAAATATAGWTSTVGVDEFALASWVADLLDRQREALTEAVLRALPE